jgi:hypothetical protein
LKIHVSSLGPRPRRGRRESREVKIIVTETLLLC